MLFPYAITPEKKRQNDRTGSVGAASGMTFHASLQRNGWRTLKPAKGIHGEGARIAPVCSAVATVYKWLTSSLAVTNDDQHLDDDRRVRDTSCRVFVGANNGSSSSTAALVSSNIDDID
jgi:hypothetical protein